MPTRIERIFESIKDNAGNDVYERIKETGEENDVKAMISELENTYGADVVTRVMKPCGSQCISNNMIALAKTSYEKSENIYDFLRLLNEQRIGGGELHIRDGKIIGIYDKCYCGLAKAIKDLPPIYCSCSEGWYERLFSSVFEKPVEVKRVRTILDGSDECVFEISY